MKSLDGFAFQHDKVINGIPQTYEEIENYFALNQCWGLQTSVDVSQCNPIIIRSMESIRKYTRELCDLIQMKRFGETTVVHFGEDERVAGYSMVQLIETSLISGHFANQTNNAYIDIFSCKLFDPYKAADYTKTFFGAIGVIVNFNFR